jgi:GTP-binding protein EngB required for normal cell division
VSRGLDSRLVALSEAADLADGRMPADAVSAARVVVERAGRRLGLGVDTTVVALAGPTGAGKSTVFNLLAGAEIADAGVRRPTTSVASAAIWGDARDELLDWLEVARRHRMSGGNLDGLVLLDLPDFDSVESSHRREFERLLALVDLVVWVVDPEKYADAALHDRYLKPMAGHRATTILALNQADRLSPDAVDRCCRDLSRLLAADGLEGVRVLPVSARTGEGVDALRRAVAGKVEERTAAVERLAADVSGAAHELARGCGDGKAGKIRRADRDRLVAALAEAAGVPTVVEAVDRAHRRRGALAAGWPFARWVRRLRADPLRRLRLGDRPAADREAPAPQPTSLPTATPVQRAQVGGATRTLASVAAGDLPPRWATLVRDAAIRHEEDLGDRLDRALASADLRMNPPRWWLGARAAQSLLALVALAGAVWLLVLVGLGMLRLDDVLPEPDVAGIPLPTFLLFAGLAAGVLLALLTRLVNGAGARRRARRASRALNERVAEVANELVIAPVDDEIDARERLCAALARAGGVRSASPGR